MERNVFFLHLERVFLLRWRPSRSRIPNPGFYAAGVELPVPGSFLAPTQTTLTPKLVGPEHRIACCLARGNLEMPPGDAYPYANAPTLWQLLIIKEAADG